MQIVIPAYTDCQHVVNNSRGLTGIVGDSFQAAASSLGRAVGYHSAFSRSVAYNIAFS
jgi:hypothetical protein